jgi:hypothetical protein
MRASLGRFSANRAKQEEGVYPGLTRFDFDTGLYRRPDVATPVSGGKKEDNSGVYIMVPPFANGDIAPTNVTS